MGMERKKTISLPIVVSSLPRIGLVLGAAVLLYLYYDSTDDFGKLLVKIGGMIWFATTYIELTIEKAEARIAAQIEGLHQHQNRLDVPSVTWKDVLDDQNSKFP